MILGETIESGNRLALTFNWLPNFFQPVQNFAALDSANLPAGRVNREGRWP